MIAYIGGWRWWTGRLLALFPGYSHCLFLITYSMQKNRGRPGINCHVSDVSLNLIDRGDEGPDRKNVFNSRQTTNVTYGALLMLHKVSSLTTWMEAIGKGLQREVRPSAKM